jgi:hypothetical protein
MFERRDDCPFSKTGLTSKFKVLRKEMDKDFLR